MLSKQDLKHWTCFSSEACFLDQVSTTQTPPLTPVKEKQNALLEHPEEEEGEESLKDEMQKRTSQLTAKENEVRKSLNPLLGSELLV